MKLRTLACVVAALPYTVIVHAQSATPTDGSVVSMDAIKVEASADASAGGLAQPYAGGQVARGGRVGLLGTQDIMSTPFSITSYTNELIQDRQARSVGDVLQNDPGVRVARGFGNFQESYFIRGFILSSDDVAYNGLYSLLPRQYIATELFERVEVLRGASTFLTGASPGGDGIGGTVNLVPKRAPNDPLTRFTTGFSSGGQFSVSTDIARRFGPGDSTGIRLNVANRSGDTAIDDEHSRTSLVSLGLDWRSADTRLSADIGWQENKLKRARPNVTLRGVTSVPDAPDASSNFAQPWSYSNERDVFGTVRAEHDFSDKLTGWAAFGMRRSDEANSLANVTVTNGSTGDGNFYRFDNTRKDSVNTGELGLRAKVRTGPVGHEFVASASFFDLKKKNAYVMDYLNTFQTNLYNPTTYSRPAFSAGALVGNDLDDPALQGRTRLSSYALGDTMSFLDDKVLLTLGIRHQRLSSRSYAYNTGTENGAYDASRNSPAAGIVFKVTPSVSLYANYIEALVAGDTAPLNANGKPVPNGGESLQPYVSKQKEVGVKYDGGGLGAGLALFSTDKPRAAYDASNRFTASGKDRHQGIELTVFGEPIDRVRVLGGLTFLDAKQRSTGNTAIDGNRVIGVPRFQANLGAEWDIPGVQGLAVDGRVVYTGASYADDANTLKVPGWTRFDAGLRYMMDVDGHVVTLRARVENIANRNYWASVGGYPGNGYLVLGGPRTFSLSASMDF
ncbi:MULTISPECIES: TonB-dependent receptor [Achromobacter]|uniref:TonB-dependent receptor n=1 Tax=Achromobacter TaxID=222 RepID=UPI0006C4CF4B|nr:MULTISPECIES: TonB-dependent receptor [Achromobacter]MCG2599875.1 TonB-dependent receptor [Achromobacter sp.]CAB3846411.1 Ferrichrome receptor FcuA [Achromobacter insuavis]CUI34131.1 Ferrichrome receptor FcuA precursor [Achromobacter sp. 2789STDY5608621]